MDKKHDKYYAVIMSDGKIMGIPAEIIADNYAKYYEKRGESYKENFDAMMHWFWTIVNKKDTIFKYIFWERLDSLPIPECCFHFVWCQIA